MSSPHLLISIRSATELQEALSGGVDIIDVKEPFHGSLGMASLAVMRDIADALTSPVRVSDENVRAPQLSFALGELREWRERCAEQRHAIRSLIDHAVPHYLKVGLSGAASSDSWTDEWNELRLEIAPESAWVAVAYADYKSADAPHPDSVLQAAIELNSRVFLIDTFEKNGRGLLDSLDADQLESFRVMTRHHGIELAFAGGITAANLPMLLSLQPDVIAVRGAVCATGNRVHRVCREQIRKFAELIAHP